LSPFIKSIRNKAENHKTLIQNFSYLSALQIFNLILPLITYPYLIRVLGKETYGLVVFAQAIVAYLAILVSFGFNISATKEISIHRDNKEKLSEIVSCVIIIKGLLLVLSILFLGVLLFIIPQANQYKALFFFSLWSCLYDVIFPIWYFQGIEQMKYITYITLVSRLTFLGLIFLLINSSADYLFVPMIYGVGAFIAGMTALYIIFIQHQIRFKWQSIINLKHYFNDSIPIFVSNISISLYVSTNKVITGTFLGMSEVAYYDLAEKLINILKIPQGILSQSLFPKISKEKNINFIKRIFNLSVGLNSLFFLFMLIFSKHIIMILGGSQMLPSHPVVLILALTVPIIAMSNIFAIQILIPFGYNKTFTRVIVTSGIIYLIQIILIGIFYKYTIINISIITLLTEIFVTAYSYYFCKKYNLWN
jgi:PST family polysaccharide transporter